MYKTTVQLILMSPYLLGVVVRGPLQGSIISPVPCDKHNFRLYVHRRVTCFHYIPSSLWQAQLLPICSSKIRMLTYPQLHVTNTTSACMFTQLSHVSSICPAPCDKHNVQIYVHPSVTCFHYIPIPLWQTQLPPICSPNCHMFPLYPHPPVVWFSIVGALGLMLWRLPATVQAQPFWQGVPHGNSSREKWMLIGVDSAVVRQEFQTVAYPCSCYSCRGWHIAYWYSYKLLDSLVHECDICHESSFF